MKDNLTIDGLEVPLETVLECRQTYSDREIADFRRFADNSGVVRVIGSAKVATRLRGKGWAPSALEGLTRGQTYVIGCLTPRQVSSATTSVTLPAARRSDPDHAPIGLALVPHGNGTRLVTTPISGIVADVATLDAVAGALAYRVHYWPEITAVITANECEGGQDATYDWSLEAEEV